MKLYRREDYLQKIRGFFTTTPISSTILFYNKRAFFLQLEGYPFAVSVILQCISLLN